MIRLPYLVEVQELVDDETDADGGVTERWRTVDKRHAMIEGLSAREQVQAAGVESLSTHRVTMRNGGLAVTAKHRLKYGTRLFQIEGVIREERKPGTQVATCTEVV